MRETPPPKLDPKPHYLSFTTIQGYFLQDDPKTDPATFDFMTANFGLIDRLYDSDTSVLASRHEQDHLSQWQRFEQQLARWNSKNDTSTSVRLLFLARHGQGYHNVAERFYGREDWNCYYSALPGNGTLTWFDAHLTDVGTSQASTLSAFWRNQILIAGTPAPHSYYASPLMRCLQTCDLTFGPLISHFPAEHPFRPVIKELGRETLGIHTCDKRSPATYIKAQFPDFKLEPGFSEEDKLWRADKRESDSAHDVRTAELLDDIFTSDAKTVISLTSHSGAVASLLRVIGHRPFQLKPGGAVPVLVRVERIEGMRPRPKVDPWTPMPTCREGFVPDPI